MLSQPLPTGTQSTDSSSELLNTINLYYMSEVKNAKANWYLKLMEKFDALIEKLAVPEDVASEFKVFLLETAREQYMAGNRSGIAWARKTPARSPA